MKISSDTLILQLCYPQCRPAVLPRESPRTQGRFFPIGQQMGSFGEFIILGNLTHIKATLGFDILLNTNQEQFLPCLLQREIYFNILEHLPGVEPVTLITSTWRLRHCTLPQRSVAGPTRDSAKKGSFKSFWLAFLPKEFQYYLRVHLSAEFRFFVELTFPMVQAFESLSVLGE